jgi:hypothetical protein
MALTAVTGLKIDKITRSIDDGHFPKSNGRFFPTFFDQNLLNTGLSYALPVGKHNVRYELDISWVNPNTDSHYTTVTVYEVGMKRVLTEVYYTNLANEVLSLNQNNVTAAQAEVYAHKLCFATGIARQSQQIYYAQNESSSSYVGGGRLNRAKVAGCTFYLSDLDPNTSFSSQSTIVTVEIRVTDTQETKTSVLTKTISLGDSVVLDGPLTPQLGANGSISTRFIDPAFVTESDSVVDTARLLDTASPIENRLVRSPYVEVINQSVVSPFMTPGRFYTVSTEITYGSGLDATVDLLPEKITPSHSLTRFQNVQAWAGNYLSSAIQGKATLALYYFYMTLTGNSTSTVRLFSQLSQKFKSNADVKYEIFSLPSIETTSTPVIRTVVGQPFTYVVKSVSGGTVTAAAAGAASFSLGTIPTGLTATIDPTGTITATMTAAGTYTLQVFATNAVGTSTGSVKFTAAAFVGNDTSIELSPSEPIDLALSASSPATFTLVSTSAEVPTGALTIVSGRLNGVLRFAGSYTATIRATLTGSSPVVSDDFTISISVRDLDQPLSVRATSVRRVLSSDKTTVSYYGVIEWLNNETKNHSVKVDRYDNETGVTLSTSFPKSSQKTTSILIGSWNASTEFESKSFSLKVYVVGDYSTSNAGLGSYGVSTSQAGKLTGQLAYDDVGNINLPSFDLAQVSSEFDTTVGLVTFTADALTTPQISSTAPPPSTWKIFEKIDASMTSIPKSSLQFTTLQQVYGLKDGGRYFAEARYSLAGSLTVVTESSGKKVWSAAANNATASVGFEYYYRGLQPPSITSQLSVFADVGTTFQYQIVALGAASFGATLTNLPEFYLNTESGMIEGIFTSAGIQVIPITASNRKGTSSQSLTVTVRDFYSDPKSIRAIVNRYIRQKLEASRDSTWTIVSGAPAGVSIITDSVGTPYLVGSVAATGSYSIVLRATQKNYTPTRFVDVTYTLSVLSTDFLDPSEMPTVIVTPSNLKSYTSDKPLLIGDKVKIAFKSDPAPAEWAADGLPPGLKIDRETGTITGTVTTAGTYLTQVTATAIGRAASLPLIVDFIVDPTTAAKVQEKGAGEAIARFPWLAAKWDLIDLQINARTRLVQSSLMVDSLAFKIGDDLRFGVFFIDGDEQSFAIAPTRIRLTIRAINNVDDPLIFESVDSPTVVTEEDTPYYELASVRGVDSSTESMSIVEDWIISQQATTTATSQPKIAAPLACVGEIEWVKNGKSYSSATFPVGLDLDVNR